MYLFGIRSCVSWSEVFLSLSFLGRNNSKISKLSGPWKVPKISVDIYCLHHGFMVHLTLFWLDIALKKAPPTQRRMHGSRLDNTNPSRHDPLLAAFVEIVCIAAFKVWGPLREFTQDHLFELRKSFWACCKPNRTSEKIMFYSQDNALSQKVDA